MKNYPTSPILSTRTVDGNLLRVLALLFCVLTTSALRAQILDSIVFGTASSESAHAFSSNSTQTGSGQLGQTTRTLLPLNPNGIYGGDMSFTMAVDPSAQNFFTIKIWGGDHNNSANFILQCDGFNTVQWLGGFDYPAEGKFFYRTIALPLWLTRGQTTMSFKIRSLGNQNPYTRNLYSQYQGYVSQPTEPIYRGYTHTNAYFTPPSDDAQVAAPAAPAAHPAVDPTAQIASMEASMNTHLTALMNSTTALPQANIEELALGYTTSWSSIYQNPAVITRVINDTDTAVAAYYGDTGLANSEWGGGFFKIGHAITLLYSQLSSQLDATANYGVGGTLTRRTAWSTALRADVDQSRYNRKTIANQAFAVDTGIYESNKALEVIDPSNALPEAQAQDYLMQTCGMEFYKGSDLPAGGSAYQDGPNYWMVTPKGDSRESGWVGSDYGIVTVQDTESFYEMTGNTAFLNRALVMLKARAHMAYAGNDGSLGNGNGYYSMLVADEMNIRNDYTPGRPYYVDIATAAASLDTTAIGYVQQAIADNQLFSNIGLPSVWVLAKYYPVIAAQPTSSARMPLTPGQPDTAWADEDDQVVAVKHGSDVFFANLYYRATGVDQTARVYMTGASADRHGDIVVDDVIYDNSGTWTTGNGLADPQASDVEPDNPITASYGVHTPNSTAYGGIGRAKAYTLQYGNYLIGMNSDENSSTYQYTVKLPPGFTSALDLISGTTMSAPIVLSPQNSVVLYLPTIPSGQAIPSRPVFFTGAAGNAQVALAWDPPSNATTYNVKRGTATGGPYTSVATGLILPSYMDTGVTNGTTYYYVVTAVNTAGESGVSTELTETPAAAGSLAFPWAAQTISNTTDSGTATLSGGTATLVTGSYGYVQDVYKTYDDFNFMYQTLPGNGSITARVVSETAGNYNECGLMVRGSLLDTSLSSSLRIAYYNGAFGLGYGNRFTDGALPAVPATTPATTPYYLRLVRDGFTVTSYASPDGVTWTPVVESALPAMSNSVYIGLAAGRSATCVFDNIATSSFNSANSTATAINVNAYPSTVLSGDNVVLTAMVAVESKTSLTGTVKFYDGSTLLATVTPDTTGMATYSIASLATGSHSVTATYSGDNTLGSSTSAPITVTVTPLPTPTVVLTSSQNPAPTGTSVTYTATMTFSSAIPKINGRVYFFDGSTQFATNIVTSPSSTVLQAVVSSNGLAVGSHTLTAFFDGAGSYVSVTSPAMTQVIEKATSTTLKTSAATIPLGNPETLTATVNSTSATGTVTFLDGTTTLGTGTVTNGVATFTTSSLAFGTHTITASYGGDSTYYGSTSAASTVNVTWQTADIGSVSLTGSGTLSNGVFTLQGSNDIWGSNDAFHFTYQTLTGDGSIVARVVSQTNTSAAAKAGVMLRATLSSNAGEVSALITPTSGASQEMRTSNGQGTSQTAAVTAAAPYWVKLVRTGIVFQSFVSPDGVTWTLLASQSLNALPTTMYVGLVVSSHTTTSLSTATFDNVSVVPGGQ